MGSGLGGSTKAVTVAVAGRDALFRDPAPRSDAPSRAPRAAFGGGLMPSQAGVPSGTPSASAKATTSASSTWAVTAGPSA